METTEKKYTREQVLNFNTNDWEHEMGSGYFGHRNINKLSDEYGKWVYRQEFIDRMELKEQYYDDFKLIADFRLDQLPLGEYPDYHIHEFLNKKYFK